MIFKSFTQVVQIFGKSSLFNHRLEEGVAVNINVTIHIKQVIVEVIFVLPKQLRSNLWYNTFFGLLLGKTHCLLTCTTTTHDQLESIVSSTHDRGAVRQKLTVVKTTSNVSDVISSFVTQVTVPLYPVTIECPLISRTSLSLLETSFNGSYITIPVRVQVSPKQLKCFWNSLRKCIDRSQVSVIAIPVTTHSSTKNGVSRSQQSSSTGTHHSPNRRLRTAKDAVCHHTLQLLNHQTSVSVNTHASQTCTHVSVKVFPVLDLIAHGESLSQSTCQSIVI